MFIINKLIPPLLLCKSPNFFESLCFLKQIAYPLLRYKNSRKMNINTILLSLLVIAAYLNLYLTYNKKKKKTKLPISSREWREKVEDDNFKSWLSNRERLKDKRKGEINH